MEKYIQDFILLAEKSSAVLFGRLHLLLVWSSCLISLIVVWSIEFFVKNIIKKDYVDKNTLRKIFLAIESCNTIETIQLLQKYPNCVNSRLGSLNYTPFLIACYHGNTLLVKYMLHIDADIKSQTKRGETPFFLAVAHLINNPFSIDASCIRELFYAGCDINEPNEKGFTPLHLAAYFGHRTLVKWLLEKGANTRVSPSPVEIASKQGHLEVASAISTWENRRRMITPN
ncbi:ankyrin-1-like isoform X1 [Coccinella septempunctata]|uniref:ankyrin-1-like isoform X1 n=1 Tax=Coccinella septempunctata TaxID=41139 RepID=UPI001D0619B8|nr:ankyrin-1-like isoform X1 [Coccinella septempunctata]